MTSDTEATLQDIWGASPTSVFAVGSKADEGLIYHYDGTQWHEMKSATYHHLNAVWGASANDVFAVGESGTIVHYNGSVWSPMASWTGDNLIYVGGNSATDAFAVGFSGNVFHYDGHFWEKVTTRLQPQLGIDDVWGESVNNLFAVSSGYVFHFDGHDWEAVNIGGESDNFRVVWGDGKDVYFLNFNTDGNPQVLLYDGDSWQVIKTWGMTFHPVALAGASPNQLYLLGSIDLNTQVHRFDGNSWELIGIETADSAKSLRGIWGIDAGDIFSVGEKGAILHYDGDSWEQMTSGTEHHLNDVWGDQSNSVIAVGDFGTILRYNSSEWVPVESGTGRNLNAVWSDSQGRGYIVGDGGTIIHFNGETWSPMTSGTYQDLTDVWGADTGPVYAVGKGAVFLVNDGADWLPAGSLPQGSRDIGGIWYSSGTDLYASIQISGHGDELYLYDGFSWENALPHVYEKHAGIRGISADDIFFFSGESPTIHHYDGTDWNRLAPFDGLGYHDVWGTETDVFVVGTNETIIHATRPDNTPPKILGVSPENGATDVILQGFYPGTKKSLLWITVQFSEPVKSGYSIVVQDEAGNQITPAPPGFVPTPGSKLTGWGSFKPGTTYTVTVSAGVEDFSGNALAQDYSWSFTTQAEETPLPGVWITSDLWIRAVINTGDKGKIVGRWQLGGEDRTARGDRVIWGYFYADPADVSWGNRDNPDLFVKIWFDKTGSLYISYFHVSVPEIQVTSDYTAGTVYGGRDRTSTATLSARHVGHFFFWDSHYERYWVTKTYQFEDGRPAADRPPASIPDGYELMGDLGIGAVINTEDKGPIEGIWRLGGQGTTLRGDNVLWGYFYADPDIMSWGSAQNPDLFVKAWYDVGGAVFLDFFHVSVPDIEVFSNLPFAGSFDNEGTTTLDNRFIEHRYHW